MGEAVDFKIVRVWQFFCGSKVLRNHGSHKIMANMIAPLEPWQGRRYFSLQKRHFLTFIYWEKRFSAIFRYKNVTF